MSTNKLVDHLKKLVSEWHSKFPTISKDNKDLLKIIKDFPLLKIINICVEKMSFNINSQILKANKEDMAKHVKRLKEHERDMIFRQSTLFAQVGLLTNRAEKLEKKIKKLEGEK